MTLRLAGTTAEVRAVVAWAVERGWRCDRTASGHIRLRRPGSPIIVAGSGKGDWRAARNLRSAIARAERAIGS